MKSFDRTTGIARGIGGMSTADAQKTACDGKGRFPSRVLAEASAVRMRKRKSQHQAAQTYRCHHCGKWHIGGSRPAYVVHSTQNFKRRRREAGEVGGNE